MSVADLLAFQVVGAFLGPPVFLVAFAFYHNFNQGKGSPGFQTLLVSILASVLLGAFAGSAIYERMRA